MRKQRKHLNVTLFELSYYARKPPFIEIHPITSRIFRLCNVLPPGLQRLTSLSTDAWYVSNMHICRHIVANVNEDLIENATNFVPASYIKNVGQFLRQAQLWLLWVNSRNTKVQVCLKNVNFKLTRLTFSIKHQIW